jgi:hypothetical protein
VIAASNPVSWLLALDPVYKATIAAVAFVLIGSSVGADVFRYRGVPARVETVERTLAPLPGRVEELERRVGAAEGVNVRQDAFLAELADGRRFNTCLGLAASRGYDVALCEEFIPDATRFIPRGVNRRN